MINELAEKQHQERWLNTPLKSIIKMDWQALPSSESVVNPLMNQLEMPENAILLILCNGVLDPRWFHDQQLPEGMIVRILDQQVDIQIMKGSDLVRPIVIHHISHFESLPENITHPMTRFQINIKMEVDSSAHFLMIESGNQAKQPYLLMPHLNLDLEAHACCHFIRAGLNAKEGLSFFKMNIEQDQYSQLFVTNYQSGGKISRSDLTLSLKGQMSESVLFGLNLAKEKQHLANVIDIDHCVPNCQTNQQMRSLLQDQSMALFDGKIHVFLDAQKTDAA